MLNSFWLWISSLQMLGSDGKEITPLAMFQAELGIMPSSAGRFFLGETFFSSGSDHMKSTSSFTVHSSRYQGLSTIFPSWFRGSKATIYFTKIGHILFLKHYNPINFVLILIKSKFGQIQVSIVVWLTAFVYFESVIVTISL